MKAMFAGSFNPPTLGHLDVIRTAARMFDEVLVCVMPNFEKKYKLSPEQRVELLDRCTAELSNVTSVVGNGLTAEFAVKNGCGVLIRGIRTINDFEFELQSADVNRKLYGIETLLLPTKPELGYISSTVVTDIVKHGGSITGMVPQEIEAEIIALLS